MILFIRLRTCLIGLPLGLAAIALFAWGYAWYEAERFYGRVALIDRDGQPTNLKELQPAVVADDDNADFFIRKAWPGIFALDVEFAKFPGLYQDEMTDERAAELTKLFAAQPHLFSTLERAANCEHYVPVLEYDTKPQSFSLQSLESLNRLRSIARVASIRMKYLVHVGNPDEAATIGINGLRLCRRVKQPRLMIDLINVLAARGILLHALNEILQIADVSAESHRRLADELSLFDPQEEFRATLIQERGYNLAAMTEWGSAFWIHANAVLDLLELEIDTAAEEHFEHQVQKVPVGWQTVMAATMCPSFLSTRHIVSDAVAVQRCLQIVNAWRAAGAPVDAKFEQIVPDKTARRDPYSGTDLIARPSPQGLLIYSVGRNGVDDGGDLSAGRDRGWTYPKMDN